MIMKFLGDFHQRTFTFSLGSKSHKHKQLRLPRACRTRTSENLINYRFPPSGTGEQKLKLQIPTFWDWFQASFIAASFRSNATDHLIPDFPVPGRLASFNQIIGGVGLMKEETVV